MARDDRSLWPSAAAGDADAFGLLFERHATLIYNYCFRRVGDWASAEDLVSVVFLEAWRRRNTLLLPDNALPWLYGIATNVLRNRRRSERRYAAALRRVPEPPPEPDFAADALARLDDERLVQSVLTDVSKLPRREQDVFFLCALFYVSYEDAALALGVPVGTVRSRLSRARQRLRELRAASGEDDEITPTSREALES